MLLASKTNLNCKIIKTKETVYSRAKALSKCQSHDQLRGALASLLAVTSHGACTVCITAADYYSFSLGSRPLLIAIYSGAPAARKVTKLTINIGTGSHACIEIETHATLLL